MERLVRDERGASAVFMALSLSAVLGVVAVGLNAAAGLQSKGRLQAAADAAAHGAALALRDGRDPLPMARALALENVADRAVYVEVEWPPRSGTQQGNPAAVRVILAEPRPVLLASLLGSEALTVRSAATARLDVNGPACLLALGGSPAGLDRGPAGVLKLQGCVSLSGADGLSPARLAQLNPYPLNLAGPPCTPGTFVVSATSSFGPATFPPYRCGGIRVAAGGRLTLSAPLVHVTGPLVVEPGGHLTTLGTTLAVGPNPVRFEPGSRISLSPPAAGVTAGVSLLGAQDGPPVTSILAAGSGQSIAGAIALPAQRLQLSGNSAACTQAIAREIAIAGETVMSHSCAGLAIRPIALQSALLVE